MSIINIIFYILLILMVGFIAGVTFALWGVHKILLLIDAYMDKPKRYIS